MFMFVYKFDLMVRRNADEEQLDSIHGVY
jgi:hypothetical protein